MAGQKNPGSAEHLEGSVKEAIGKLIGDDRIAAEGRRQKHDARPPVAAGLKATDPAKDTTQR
ncbi:CsbD family protein [Methylobacterium persicinum]|uniref:Uncharacterized protein YjbJ (UPF0337 family) n=1 Tax=Methylobacterium persicinum TaxID=374426 RepID=A0ABU0HS56_9HYPH|nr:CsbD family protein [Methylobacterium persicinum]MDQ0444535.1 uncharacterized protein YjbJ (UPF0337 family) [Methylobacterium persicinum]GJE40431.1 hypothetical protein KHHGKMAE_4524 [Methylobacterium persicinum]